MTVDLLTYQVPKYEAVIKKIENENLNKKIDILISEINKIKREFHEYINKNPLKIYELTPTVQLTIEKIYKHLHTLKTLKAVEALF